MTYAKLAGILLGLSVGAGSVMAQDLPQVKDFKFKRVKVSDAKPGKRITVQIDPVEQALALAPPPPLPDAKKRERTDDQAETPSDDAPKSSKAAYGWFWDSIPPSTDQTGPGRLEEAVIALASDPKGGSVRAPRLSTLQKLANAHGTEILKATVGTEVSPALALAVISVESAGRANAVSSAGAQGLMQLMPATAKRFGVSNSNDPSQNIKGGVAYLDWLMNKFERDPLLVLAGYNAGENAVIKHKGIPPYDETRDYVPKVLAAWNVARGLCITPPQLAHDGCVFRTGS
ncbi:lytic transglycosylase domain-containing protein [Actibacterium sp. 188UL27-1]|uniref:lytic transglycosylase domain-containing protein n=1 Tax=Actibacterium sp. 188UL27-1 TaxID=2786961 RepID=UPI00195BDA73|nr:lytic transglycosylase domain-containing protein [Actibacterium sp. 188UL27-1]MBM7068215.1 lytic transglycosylase domain-containing protein [Actibacterium sp. 188UL27-1]